MANKVAKLYYDLTLPLIGVFILLTQFSSPSTLG
ncbi:uncharacterized protein G2W53_013655 [Senna tora]|uniref:Uncharacterized protein n=1 Tax=Senna tora TaxID=362788 RepID=A0A834WQX5_9FABA|nr:uncharacterized protein G2W53_013655 [Senna tora]